jgi:molecular chaperone DnaK
MGGIRLDVSVMEITGNVFDVVATGGDAYLGGANLDARIAEWILANIRRKFSKDLSQEPALLMKVRTAAEQAKRELSRFKAVDLQIPLTVGAKGHKPDIGQLRLNRDTVERLAEDLVDRVIGLTRHVLDERGLKPNDVDEVILVGGATRIPLLRTRAKELFGKEPRSNLPPEEVIALGAALLADSLRRDAQAQMEVVKEPIGIALSDGRFMKIIDKDSRVPITRRVMIPTTRDNQRTVEVDIFQGDGDDILNTVYLGTIVYGHVAEAKAGDAKIVVDLILAADRLLTISSPEPGREGEKFEIKTKEHREFKEATDRQPEPIFKIAEKVPAAART